MGEHDSPYPPGTYNFLVKTDIEKENAREMKIKGRHSSRILSQRGQPNNLV